MFPSCMYVDKGASGQGSAWRLRYHREYTNLDIPERYKKVNRKLSEEFFFQIRSSPVFSCFVSLIEGVPKLLIYGVCSVEYSETVLMRH